MTADHADLGLVKSIAMAEGRRVQLRAVTSGTFGRVTTAGNPRVMQIALKVTF